jgi:quaternary ammonium compound-resistance protein SugE
MSVGLAWTLLLVAGILEIGWAIGLKFTDGFTRPGPSFTTLALMAVSIFILSLSVKTLPIGTAYAVWTGIGAVGTAILGIIFFGELTSPLRLGSIALIIIGIAGLRVSGS